ncbi:MAG: glutathione S-transferase N-terminal domain-containing protein [Rhodospirillales bacterium]|nr:MAG: glutathione S-transferase N-terminal domain-containing protein [Rhodospirillales bacterium]
MRLLSATPSPYARKARIALMEKGLPFELVTEVPWNDDASAPAHNPLGKIPVLILDDGAAYYDSRFILEYLELTHPLPSLLPKDAAGILAHKRLEVLGDGLCDALVLILIERMREPEKRSQAWIVRQRRKIEGALAEIARLVSPDTPFTCGDSFGLGDIAVGSALGYMDPRFPELDWRARHPHLAALHARLSTRPSFAATVPVVQTMRDKVV